MTRYVTPPTENIVPPVYTGEAAKYGWDLPTHYADTTPAIHRLMGRYAQRPRGLNLWLMMDGSVSTDQPPQWNPADPTGPVTRGYNPFTFTDDKTFLPANQQVRKMFMGGMDNPITAEEETLLTAAGYGAYCHS